MAAYYKLGRTCDCGQRIPDNNKSGRCRACHYRNFAADPEIRQRSAETHRQRLRSDPAYRAKKARVVAENLRAARINNPTARDNLRAAAIRNLAKAYTPEAKALKAANNAPGYQRHLERLYAWCPPEKKAFYHWLVRYGKQRAADAKRIILDEIRIERERAEARLSPFERQERALQRGAQLVANDRGCSLDRPGVYAAEDKWVSRG